MSRFCEECKLVSTNVNQIQAKQTIHFTFFYIGRMGFKRGDGGTGHVPDPPPHSLDIFVPLPVRNAFLPAALKFRENTASVRIEPTTSGLDLPLLFRPKLRGRTEKVGDD